MHRPPLLDASPNAPQKGPHDTPNDDRRGQPAAAQSRRPRFALSLTTRIALVTAGLSTALGAAIVVGSLQSAHADLRAALQAQQDSVVKLTAEQLDSAVNDRLILLEHLAPQLKTMLDAPPAQLQAMLSRALPIPGTFNSAVVVDARGMLLARDGTVVSVADRTYFREAARTLAPVISPPIRARADGSVGVLLAVPIVSDDKTFLGLVGGWIDLGRSNFLVEVPHSPIGSTGFYCLVSAGPRPVYVQHRLQQQVGRPAQALGETCGVRAHPAAFEFVSPREPVIARYLMATTGWELVAVLPAKEAFQPLHAMQQRFLLWSAVAVGMVAMLNWFAVHWMFAPLAQLRRVVRDSARDLSAYERLSTHRHDEIGVLARAFARLMRDVRERREQLHRSEARLRAVTDTLPSLLAFIDTDERYVFNNLAYERTFGIPLDQLRGMTLRELLGEARYARIQPYLQQALGGTAVTFETEFHDPDYHCTETNFRPEWSADGSRVEGVHVHVQDITARKLETLRLAQISRLDHLTQLLNRSAFETRLAEAMARSRSQDRMMALLYLDMDRFKAVNDHYGHAAGDQLLQSFAKRVQRCVRERDAVARLGGDEFAIVMEDIDRPDVAVRVAGAILHSVGRRFFIEGAFVDVNVSIGIALYQGGPITWQQLAREADALLYRAKDGGRGRFEIGPPELANRPREARS